MEKPVPASSSRLSTSEWSLDGSAGEPAGSGASKGIVDPAGSVPALWTPLETSTGTPLPSSKGRNIIAWFHLVCMHGVSSRDVPDCKFYYPAGTG